MNALRPGGPVLRTVLAITLPSESGAVYTPAPMSEFGGIPAVPEGTLVRLDIGDARRCFDHEADKIAGALISAAEIEIVGTDVCGVTETRVELAAALARAHLIHTG